MSKKRKVDNLGLDLLKLMPVAKTEEQEAFINAMQSNDVIFVHGPAGSGKTWLATLYGLYQFFAGKYEKIILTRPCIEANGEKLGYLPMAM